VKIKLILLHSPNFHQIKLGHW